MWRNEWRAFEGKAAKRNKKRKRPSRTSALVGDTAVSSSYCPRSCQHRPNIGNGTISGPWDQGPVQLDRAGSDGRALTGGQAQTFSSWRQGSQVRGYVLSGTGTWCVQSVSHVSPSLRSRLSPLWLMLGRGRLAIAWDTAHTSGDADGGRRGLKQAC